MHTLLNVKLERKQTSTQRHFMENRSSSPPQEYFTSKYNKMADFVRVTDDENEEAIEIPLEDDGIDHDGTLLLTSLIAQFPGACGLKYRSESGGLRGVRLANGSLHPPNGFWGQNTYIVNFPKGEFKRKVDDDDIPVTNKIKRMEGRKCSDLIVLGLPWKSTEEDMQDYFKQFGDLILTQVKRDPRSGQSKGFGFIRFKEYESQLRCLGTRHKIDGRWCEVNVPNSHADGGAAPTNRKIFVARCTEDLTTEDLSTYFEQFGEVIDVFIPKPFRAFAFVTFADPNVADRLCGEDHIIKGASVHISSAEPKGKDSDKNEGRGRSYSNRGGNSNKGYGRDRDDNGWGGSNSKQGNPQEMLSGDANLNNIGMNMLSSAMLAAAQAVMQGNTGQQGSTENYQLGPGFGGTRDSRSTTSYSTSASGWGGDASQGQGSYSAWGSRSGGGGGGYSTGTQWGQGQGSSSSSSSRGWSNMGSN